MAFADTATQSHVHYRGLRDWLDKVQGMGELHLDYAYASAVPPDPEPITGRTFLGYRRKDGRAATRNHIGLVSTVNCSATTSKYVAQAISPLILKDFPNIDGIVPLVHKGGCAMQYEGEDHQQLARTLAGFARHPNIAAYLVLGLGCETAGSRGAGAAVGSDPVAALRLFALETAIAGGVIPLVMPVAID